MTFSLNAFLLGALPPCRTDRGWSVSQSGQVSNCPVPASALKPVVHAGFPLDALSWYYLTCSTLVILGKKMLLLYVVILGVAVIIPVASQPEASGFKSSSVDCRVCMFFLTKWYGSGDGLWSIVLKIIFRWKKYLQNYALHQIILCPHRFFCSFT